MKEEKKKYLADLKKDQKGKIKRSVQYHTKENKKSGSLQNKTDYVNRSILS